MGFDPLKELLRLSKEFMEMKIPAFNSQLLTMIKEYFLITSKGCGDLASKLQKAISKRLMKLSRNKKRLREKLIIKFSQWTNDLKIYEELREGPRV